MATATTNKTPNYALSQYTANDPVKFLTNYNSDMSVIDSNMKSISTIANGAVPTSRTIAGLDLSTNRTLDELIAKGLASGTNGDANNALKLGGITASTIIDGFGNANNALKLGGNLASLYPTISSGSWTPTIYGTTVVGSPTYSTQSGHYCLIGNVVFLFGTIRITAKGGLTGNVRLGGLPFVAQSSGVFHTSINTSVLNSGQSLLGIIDSGNYVTLFVQTYSTGAILLSDTNINDNFEIDAFGGYYLTV